MTTTPSTTPTMGSILTRETYDSLTCCNTPVEVSHATPPLGIAGAVCRTCLCVITSVEYGEAYINRCAEHRNEISA